MRGSTGRVLLGSRIHVNLHINVHIHIQSRVPRTEGSWPMADVTPVSALPELGSALEASNVLRISRTQVYRLMDEGVIESVRVGGRRLVVWESVQRLLQPEGTAS